MPPMRIFDFFKRFRTRPTIRFKCHLGRFDISQPVQSAKDVIPAWLRKQIKSGTAKFARCPGMHDYLQAGYIISAWCDIHILASSEGVSIRMGRGDTQQPEPFDFSLVDGLAPIVGDVERSVFKIPIPYAVFTEPGYSAYLLPALMHSPFLGDIFVYPGVVDYDKKFTTAGFIFSPLRECELTIPAGTPLLQVIPFKREPITAVTGLANDLERGIHGFGFASRVTGYYRRVFHQKKSFTIKIEDQEE